MDYGLVKMNAAAAGEQMRSPVPASAGKGPLVCPRPRRLGIVHPQPHRGAPNFRPESFDSKAGKELLELLLSRGSQHPVESPPPFLCGSPPSRAPNPLIRDSRFGQEKPPPPPPAVLASPATPGSPSAAARKGCGPLKFGPKPATVRIEGFDCLASDGRSRGIAAVA